MSQVVFEDKRSFYMTLSKAALFLSRNPGIISDIENMFTSNHLLAQQVTTQFEQYSQDLLSFITSYNEADVSALPRVRADPDRIYIDGC